MLTATYSKLAQKLYPIKLVFIVGIILLVCFIGYMFMFKASEGTNAWLVPAALGILWLLLCYMLTVMFVNFPDFSPLKEANTKRLTRWKLKAQRLAYRIMSVVYTLLSISLIFLTLRSLRLVLS